MAKVKFTSVQLLLPIEDVTTEIPTKHGHIAIVDATDGDLASVRWNTMSRSAGYTLYAYRDGLWNGCKGRHFMHQIIIERILGYKLERGIYPDHIDGNGLNNRRSNLRLATISQNQANVGRRKDNTSGYKGVYFKKSSGKWAASLQYQNKRLNLGYFDTPELAYVAYCEAARHYFGEFARLE